MGPHANEAFERFHNLDLPLRNLRRKTSAKGIEDALTDALPACSTKAQKSSEKGWDGQIHIETFSLGALICICAKTTPMLAVKEESELKTVVLQYAGKTTYEQERETGSAPDGSILIHNNRSGLISVTGGCAITFELDPIKLARTRRAIGGRLGKAITETTVEAVTNENSKEVKKWFGLFNYVDTLLEEDQSLPTAMGIDEQIYRLMAIHQLRAVSGWSDSAWQDKRIDPGETVINKLEDYIAENCYLGLTLTDLEEHSSYSGRQLQNRFMDKHACTPMQYVRRVRLSAALERIETATAGDSVALIARELGYRQANHFSADFKKQYGHCPSEILRSVLLSQNLKPPC